MRFFYASLLSCAGPGKCRCVSTGGCGETLKRDKRSQVVILENGKFVVLEHLVRKENRSFWALPGGGRQGGETDEEAALREAREETGLEVCLLPFRHECHPIEEKSLYRRVVTFLAYPVSGEAALGYDPEAELSELYRLVDMKWQGLYDREGLGPITNGYLDPVRQFVSSIPVRRAGVCVHGAESGENRYLLVSTRKTTGFWVLPQGHVEDCETPEQAAVREAREEAGADVTIQRDLGFFLQVIDGEVSKTQVFLGSLTAQSVPQEVRLIRWVTRNEMEGMTVLRQTRRFIEDADDQMAKTD